MEWWSIGVLETHHSIAPLFHFMKFTLNWLNEFIAVKTPPDKLAEMLTMAGFEVESLTRLSESHTNHDDWLFEIAVTPNRGDCLGLKGIAREVAALTGARVKPSAALPRPRAAAAGARISVTIDDPRLCPRYSARVVDGIEIAPSPPWLRFRLEACGIRAINNVVDITNYVMLETGQPLHAFDYELLPAHRIVVRPAGRAMKFTTLDGVVRDLVADDLLIWAGDDPVALAGVMGGMESEVRETTKSVLLESANFDGITIRRTAKRLMLHSEASHRFERGVDPDGTVVALDRAAAMLAELARAIPVPGVVDCHPRRSRPSAITLREQRIAQLLGVAIDGRRAEKLLQSLGVKTRRRAGKIISCVPPPDRADLTREADLIEELARLHGYDKIPSSMPRLRTSDAVKDKRLTQERRVRAFLAGEGLVEVINLPFTSAKLNRIFTGLWEGAARPAAVVNPLVKECADMRLSLVPGLIENLRVNLAQKAESFRAYHLGKVFRMRDDGAPEERLYLSGILYGPRARRGLRDAGARAVEFFDCKGVAEGVLDLLRVPDEIGWSADAVAALHPGRAAVARIGAQKLGYLGQIHPGVCDELGVPPAYVYELDLEKLLEYAPQQITTTSLPRFPSVGRDFALVVDRDFQSQRIMSWIKNLRDGLIENVEVFDEYRGAPIAEGKKSLAYKVSYRAEDRTLTDAEINARHGKLVAEIEKAFGGELRS
jgi:phenylalanyl-tRNA synthetase beta chain